jgi:phosphatidylserine/phosphatidylglycerophosphate/cardiolipin synthase-like enzyme
MLAGMTVVKAFANCDHVLVAWRPEPIDATARGFALLRQYVGDASSEVAVENWTGWEKEVVPNGTRKPSTEWPIQRLLWADFGVEPGRPVRYRVAMMSGTKKALTKGKPSGWSNEVTVGSQAEAGIDIYFNRGIVASQWLTRALTALNDAHRDKALREAINDPASTVREELSGRLSEGLLGLLAKAKADAVHVYTALFELDDPALLPALLALGKKAHVVLANGAAGSSGARDENADASAALQGKVDLSRRMVDQKKYLAHNKFLVLCDKNKVPAAVWTGSTNWTATGLCTQVNNGILIRSKTLADAFLTRWKDLKAAGDDPPPTLADKVVTATTTIAGAKVTAWFAPVHDRVDLEDAAAHIRAAQQAILFLMFNPGPQGTLLNDIISRVSPLSPDFDDKLCIRGVVNDDPGTKKTHVVNLFRQAPEYEVIKAFNVQQDFAYWDKEMRKLSGTWAMVHSKVIVIDPFGDKPVLMTGSHNMGPKASSANDDNLVILEGAPLAAQHYAVNIMGVFMQYHWRYNNRTDPQHGPDETPGAGRSQWGGLKDNKGWSSGLLTGARGREIDMWLGS